MAEHHHTPIGEFGPCRPCMEERKVLSGADVLLNGIPVCLDHFEAGLKGMAHIIRTFTETKESSEQTS